MAVTSHLDIETVQDLFVFHFPAVIHVDKASAYGMQIRGGDAIPIDSPCGADCEKAIMAGAALLSHARAAYGMDDSIPEVVQRICEVYING
jgi:hypothetical protein